MWDRLAASIPAVTWKHLESPTTRAALLQIGDGAGLAVAVGVGVTGVGNVVGVAVGFTLGDAVAVGVSVDAWGVAAHAPTTSDVAINASRTSGPVLISRSPRRSAPCAHLATDDELTVEGVPPPACRPADAGS
jgi:hypothetical protein